MRPVTRKPVGLAVLCAAALSLAGCVTISSTSTSQPQSMGPLRLTVYACANGSPGCNGSSNTASAYGVLNETDSDNTYGAQLLLAVRLPDGAVPEVVQTAMQGTTLTFARSESLEAELQALEPAPAGERWWGWLSSQFMYGRKTTQSFTATIESTLPRPADGGALPSPMRWRPTVGVRYVLDSLPAARPVDCGTTNDQLYHGYGEAGANNDTIVCVDSPAPDATRGFLEAPLTDFGITGSRVLAPAGSTVTATFLARRSGTADATTSFALGVSGGVPGGTVTLDRTSVSLGGESSTPVLATVTVPAGTAAGEYPLTLTATAAGKPARAGTATVEVSAPTPAPQATPTPGPPPAADTQAPVISAASLRPSRLRRAQGPTPLAGAATVAGTQLRVTVSEASTLVVSVQRLLSGRRSGRACSLKARRGARCTIARPVGELRRTLRGGAAKIAFSGRLGTRKLSLGRHRLVLRAVDAAGNRSPARTLTFTIVAR